MAQYQSPQSDNGRLTFLKQTEKTAGQDIAAGNDYLSQETLDRITAFIPDFEKAVNTVTLTSTRRAKEIKEQNQALENIQMYVRDLWATLRRRVKRLDLPTSVLKYYRLPLDGTIPYPNTRKEWLVLSTQVIEGDADAVAAGYAPMSDPSVAELREILDVAELEVADVTKSDREYDLAQAVAAELRPQADGLITEVMDELRYRLRKLDGGSNRRIMRTYGANYRYLQGEPVDEDEAIDTDNGEDNGEDNDAGNGQKDKKDKQGNPVSDLATSGS